MTSCFRHKQISWSGRVPAIYRVGLQPAYGKNNELYTLHTGTVTLCNPDTPQITLKVQMQPERYIL